MLRSYLYRLIPPILVLLFVVGIHYYITYGVYNGAILLANFGNPIVALSSAVADADGYGAFEFAPPSGYFALCTKNLAEYG